MHRVFPSVDESICGYLSLVKQMDAGYSKRNAIRRVDVALT